jgi:hypothetical protein
MKSKKKVDSIVLRSESVAELWMGDNFKGHIMNIDEFLINPTKIKILVEGGIKERELREKEGIELGFSPTIKPITEFTESKKILVARNKNEPPLITNKRESNPKINSKKKVDSIVLRSESVAELWMGDNFKGHIMDIDEFLINPTKIKILVEENGKITQRVLRKNEGIVGIVLEFQPPIHPIIKHSESKRILIAREHNSPLLLTRIKFIDDPERKMDILEKIFIKLLENDKGFRDQIGDYIFAGEGLNLYKNNFDDLAFSSPYTLEGGSILSKTFILTEKENRGKKEKIKVEKFKIIDMEGRSDLVDIYKDREAKSWEQINNILTDIAGEMREDVGGNKIFIKVIYEDGKTYEAKYFLRPLSREAPNLGRHIRDFALAYSGKKKPTHMSQKEYERYLKFVGEPQEKYKDLLNEYEIIV